MATASRRSGTQSTEPPWPLRDSLDERRLKSRKARSVRSASPLRLESPCEQEVSMKRLGTLITAVTAVAFAGTASADEVAGTVKTVDAATRQLTLSDGQAYSVAIDVPMTGLKPGDQVRLDTSVMDGVTLVSKIERTTTAAGGRSSAPRT